MSLRRNEDTHIWVVVYKHRDGIEYIPCVDDEVAHEEALAIVLELRDKRNVPIYVSDEEALANWDTFSWHSESITVEKTLLRK